MLKVGFIGLGTMGFPIAGHISKSYQAYVFNRTLNKSQKWTSEFEGVACESLKDLTLGSDVIFLCLSEDKDIEEIVFSSNGILNHINGSSGSGRGKSWTNVPFRLKVRGCYGQRKAKIHTISSPTI